MALAVGGMASTGSGIAVADDPGARAEGGSSTAGPVVQQNTAQQSRQNNNCGTPNGGRAEGRCVTGDGSFNKHTFTARGDARAEGGNSAGAVFEQNTAQKGRQNNNCANPNIATGSLSGQAEGRCVDTDVSHNEHTTLKGGDVRAEGGDGGASVAQQNTAQSGRQNNNCANPNDSSVALAGGRPESECVNTDVSRNKHTTAKGGDARAEGGSTAANVFQRNTAQSGRQNNDCANPNGSSVAVAGGQAESRCVNKDASRNKHTKVKGGGARAEGGSGAGGPLSQQNIAQSGRQNNTCADLTSSSAAVTGGSAESGCVNKDASRNKHTKVKGGDARAEGGSGIGAIQRNTAQSGGQNNTCADPTSSSTASEDGRAESGCVNKDHSHNKHTTAKGGDARAEGGDGGVSGAQQNTAQSGRQNNNCANPNGSSVAIAGGGAKSGCVNKDHSRNKHTTAKGGDARAEGGSSTVGSVFQQNTAQSGRQNNNCADPNTSSVAVAGGRAKSGCVNKDHSHNKHTTAKGGDARAEGGSGGVSGAQQNTAQSGRQNNNCADPNGSSVAVGGGRAESGCVNKDHSRNKHTKVKGGGARAEGGSGTAANVIQQNTAQSGRQNNNCANPNGATTTGTGNLAETRCKTVDHSKNIGTAEISDGAEAKGGSSALGLFQQNTAQSGRQNNNCGNPNNLTLTATATGAQAQCVAVDRSTNIGTVER
ncbi:hypothetical protein AB0D71_19185 [Streptomyces avermitilis]|uniref:hypothetical protein n=1 Tax=Streptomyces avermitilis TaxID=33903 RepID=UPI00340EE414